MTNLNCGKAALLKFTKFMYYDILYDATIYINRKYKG